MSADPGLFGDHKILDVLSVHDAMSPWTEAIALGICVLRRVDLRLAPVLIECADFASLPPSLPNPLLFDTVRRVNKKFFEITSKEGKLAYIPWSQLLRIEAIPGGGIFLSFSENFQVNIQIANGEEAAVAKRLYNDLASPLAEVIILNPETQSVTDIHF